MGDIRADVREMPVSNATRELGSAPTRWLIVTLAVTAGVLLVTMPAVVYPGDALTTRLSACAWLETGRFDVPESVATSFGERGQYYFQNPSTGRWYPKYGFANTLAYVVPLAIEQWIYGDLPAATTHSIQRRRSLTLGVFNLLLSLVGVAYLFALALRMVDHPGWAFAGVTVSVFGGFTWHYLRAQTFEIFQIVTFSGLCFHTARNAATTSVLDRALHASLAMAFAGVLVLGKLAYTPLLPLTALSICCARGGDGRIALQFNRGAWALAVGWSVAIAGLVLCCNAWRFGSPLTTGYAPWAREHNVLGGNPVEAALGFLVDPRASLPLHQPFLLAALLGLPRGIRRAGFLLGFAWVAFLLEFGIASSFVNWRGEWCYGARYLVFAVPVLTLSAAALFEQLATTPRAVRVLSRLFIGTAFVWCLACQWSVNRLPFFAAHRAEAICGELDPSTTTWFRSRPVWSVNAALIRHGRTGAFPPFQESPRALDDTAIADQLRTLTVPNLYWLHALAELNRGDDRNGKTNE